MKKTNTANIPPPPPPKKPVIPKPGDEKKKHHDALMDEFKKVHRKMFANLETDKRNSDAQRNDSETVVSAFKSTLIFNR